MEAIVKYSIRHSHILQENTEKESIRFFFEIKWSFIRKGFDSVEEQRDFLSVCANEKHLFHAIIYLIDN